MVIAALQYSPRYLEVASNLDEVERHLDGVTADLVVLPELFATGYFFRSSDDARSVAEDARTGPTALRLGRWASESGATFVAGLVEREGDRLYNSAVVVSPRGWEGTYRKVHLYYEEKNHFAPGNLGFRTFDLATSAGASYRLGVMICFDWCFPEAARTLALWGAEVIAHPSNLVRPDCPRAMPIRALENRVFTVTANRTGEESNGRETLRFIGQSRICDPRGQVLAEAGPATTTVLTATVDPEAARDKTLNPLNDQFADRRPDVYFLRGV